MLYGNISPIMSKKAVGVMKGSPSNFFTAKITIFSDQNSEVKVSPRLIKTWNIVQNTEKSYHETITATFDVSMEEALLLMYNEKDLRATILLDHVTQHHYRLIKDIPQEVRQFRVLITNKDELKKEKQKVEYLSATGGSEQVGGNYTPDGVRSMRYDLEVELMLDYTALGDGNLYTARKRPINGIAKNPCMESVVHFIANSLGIKDVRMVKPDNGNKPKTVCIPPTQDLSNLISGLQDTYGIYKKGISYFVSEGTLHVYPTFETNPNTETEIHFYKLPKDAYPGCPTYSSVDESGNLHIVLNSDVSMTDLSGAGVEVFGNYQMSSRTDTYIDTDTKMKGKQADIRNNNLLTVGAENERTITDKRVVARFNNDTNNPLQMSSNMASLMCIIMRTTWSMAWPWIIKPGTKVVYHYEDISGLKMVTGIMSSMEYSATPMNGLSKDTYVYAWGAQLTCRLSADFQEEDAVTIDMLPNMSKAKRS